MKGFESSFVPGLWVRLVGDPPLPSPPHRPASPPPLEARPTGFCLIQAVEPGENATSFCFVFRATARPCTRRRPRVRALRPPSGGGDAGRRAQALHAAGGKGPPLIIFGLASTSAISFPDTGFTPALMIYSSISAESERGFP